nr:mechanosensitive ion channel family protein [Glycomyces sp. L485]
MLAATGESPCNAGFNACSLLWRVTESEGFAIDGGAVVDKFFEVLIIALVALVLRWVVNRFIARIIKQVTSAKRPQSISELTDLLGSSRTRREEIVGDRSKQRAATLTSVLQHINGIVIISVAAMMILSAFNLDLAPILASAGIVGVAIGFGAQNLVQDYLAGIFILLEDQYGVGDVIDSGEAVGVVEDMGLRVTTLRSLDGTLWYVRNGQIMRVGNFSQSWAYVVLDIPMPPTVDVDEASDTIMEAVREFADDDQWREHVLMEPEYLGVATMTIDEITVRVGVRTTSDEQWSAGRELRRRISEKLKDSGIAMGGGRVYVPRGSAGPTPD